MQSPPKLILHIGHFKTGTTALQEFLMDNSSKLESQGVLYSPFPQHLNKHSMLAFALMVDSGVKEAKQRFNSDFTAEEVWQQVFDVVRSLEKGQSLLVSTEEFMRIGEHPAAAEKLREIFATAPDIPVKIVAYLRSPNSHLHAWYNQLVKLGANFGNFDTSVQSRMERIHWDYAQALRPWIETFGAEQVILRQFHDGLRKDNALFADFLSAIDCEFQPSMTLPPRDPNPRLDDRILDLKRAYLHANLPRPVIDRVITRAAQNLEAETAVDPLRHSLDFETIRDASEAAITALAALPQATLDVAQLTSDLPRPLSSDARMMGDLVALLGGEMASLRSSLREVNQRLTKLEGTQSPSATGPDADA